ncbi:methyltransferase [Nocardia transvalensis]|uniref:methyltransferase n=1 Tax=Nocardia transvalensis TaxID=37333 RepID=UPI001895B3AC|nr:methyltransferase [Nocardia transvalensis]MBF6331572.1 hydroxyneurosporene methyltransferase [Nocardia transvalensis]
MLPPSPLVRVVELVRYGLAEAYRRLVPGRLALMEMLVAGWLTQAIHAAAVLGLADALDERPLTLTELARAVDADEDALRRLLQLLIGHGVFARRRDGTYTLTPAARALRRDTPDSLRNVALFFGSAPHRDHWSGIVDAVRTGRPVGAQPDGTVFESLRADREFGELFDLAMTGIGALSTEALLGAYDFTRFPTIVDVGGGHGALLTEILSRAPRSRGILAELPEVTAAADARFAAAGLAQRATAEPGSFFDSVPRGGDAYLLKHVVHDWPDDSAVRLLRSVHAAMTPDARLLVVEIVLPHNDRPHPGKYIDLEMLVNSGGRERTEAEYRALLDAAGFTVTRVIPTAAPESIIEARPA